MQSRMSFLVLPLLLVAITVLGAAQEPGTLGDLAKRLREEKAAQANSSRTAEPEIPLPDMARESDRSQLASGPLSKLQIFA